jgi:Arc/MetJ-type ribon-helix-helix transcriptional regulator
MSRAISIRLDKDAQDALESLTSSGRSRSDAIREALVELARRRHRRDLAAEVARLNANSSDRAEKRAVEKLMESLRAAR